MHELLDSSMLCEKIHIEFGDVCSYATEKILEIQQAVHQALLKIQENILQVIGRIEALIQTLNNTSTRLNQDKDLTPNKIELMTQENKDMLCFWPDYAVVFLSRYKIFCPIN